MDDITLKTIVENAVETRAYRLWQYNNWEDKSNLDAVTKMIMEYDGVDNNGILCIHGEFFSIDSVQSWVVLVPCDKPDGHKPDGHKPDGCQKLTIDPNMEKTEKPKVKSPKRFQSINHAREWWRDELDKRGVDLVRPSSYDGAFADKALRNYVDESELERK